MSDEPAKPKPFYYGGQAVLEGVMMRGQEAWSLAVRRPKGEIYLEQHALAPLASRVRLFKLPFFRGIGVLGDSLAIGVKALAISGNQALEEEEQLTDRQMGWSLGIGAAFFTALFILAPAAGTNWLSRPPAQQPDLQPGRGAGPARLLPALHPGHLDAARTSAGCSSTTAPST